MFTVGTDTEFFLQTNEGELVSATRFIKGKKHNPTELKSGGNVTYDNVALEFATPIAKSEESFVAAIKSTMIEAFEYLPRNVHINPMSSMDFPEKELHHEGTKQFGCDPDFDAWLLVVNEAPPEAAFMPFRSVGGHLHVGYVSGSSNEFLLDPIGKVELVKAFDIVLGIPFTIIDHSKATINRRRLYGRAGCHRPTDYGVEYRTLSNFWTFSPSLVRIVYALAEGALELVREGQIETLVHLIEPDEIQRVINEGDDETAERLWKNIIAPTLPVNVVEKFNAIKQYKEFDIYKEWGF